MDKETLSNYGWIVICVLVLAVMLALAGPFGTFVAGAVKSTTAGLFGVNQNALGAAGITIDGQEFESCAHEYEVTTVGDCTTGQITTTQTCKLCGKTSAETVQATHKFDNANDMKCNTCSLSFTAYAFVASDYDAKMGTTTATDAHVVIPETFEYNGTHYKTSSLGKRAFFGCKTIQTVELPDSITSIGKEAFYAATLSSINLPESITTLEDYAFAGCDFEEIVIPSGVTRINMDVFSSCENLKSIVIPDGVTRIDSCAFYGCKSLTTVTIPTSLTQIGNCAFSNCSAITKVNYKGSAEQWAEISTDNSNPYLMNASINYNFTGE